MPGTEPRAGEVDERLRRRNGGLFVVYLVALLVAVVSLGRLAGPLVAGVVIGGVHLLVHAPAFEVREDLELLTDDPPDAVRETFSAAHNPMTSIWIEGADRIHDESRTDIRFDRSWFLGSFSRRYAVSVRPVSDGSGQIEVRRGDTSVVTADVEIDALETGTRLRTRTRRSQTCAFELALLTLAGSEIRRHFEACGYEPVSGRTAVGLRLPGGDRSD